MKNLDLKKLSPEERARVERALKPRRTDQLSLKFPPESIAAWRKAAEKKDEFLTDWIQRHLDSAAGVK